MGDVVAAVDRYADIPPEVRKRLKRRMAERDYDDIVSIGRDSIVGKYSYGSVIRDMHFGDGRLCHGVSRAGWTATMQERGLVYCEREHCILVPTVCRNVSRIGPPETAVKDASFVDDASAPIEHTGALPPDRRGATDAPGVGIDAGWSSLLAGAQLPNGLAGPSGSDRAALGRSGMDPDMPWAPPGRGMPWSPSGPGIPTGSSEPGIPGNLPNPGIPWRPPDPGMPWDPGAPPGGDPLLPPVPVSPPAPGPISPVPEPASWLLTATGLALLWGARRYSLRRTSV